MTATTIAAPLLPFSITICGLDELTGWAEIPFSHVVSILDPEWPDPTCFAGYRPHRRIIWRFHDVWEAREGVIAPGPEDVAAILDLGRRLREEDARRLLIHCHAGVSRSTATAVILMSQDHPGRERDAFAELTRVRPRSWPNRRMIALADDMLDRRGALVQSLGAHQRAVVHLHPEFLPLLAAAQPSTVDDRG